MRVLLPSEGLRRAVSNAIHTMHSFETHGESLDGQHRCTASDHTQLVALLLPVEDRPRGEGDNPRLYVLLFEFRSGF